MFDNIMMLTDSYKHSHWKQLPPRTTHFYSYFESRGGLYKYCTFFGLQYVLKRYLEGKVVTKEKIDAAEKYVRAHMGDHFNRAGWEYILKRHGGYLPVSIYAVPEGTCVPTKNVLMTIVNNDPKVPWLTNFLETLLVQVWYPTTVCTQSREMKKTILSYLSDTGNPAEIDFKLHDFGFRGVSSVETAGIGGAAHLVNFKGTDTMAGLIVANEVYGESMAGFSIPASEHSTITSWGREHEDDACENMLKQYPDCMVACVSDSFDIYNACENIWGGTLKDKVLNRGGVLTIRPDSGYAPDVLVKCMEILGRQFGFTENERGYKVLNPKVRLIQGDGIDAQSLDSILSVMKIHRWSADNVAFGSGGGLLQKLNRDTQKFAFKCSMIEVDGILRPVYKEPVTDPGKDSKVGYQKLVKRSVGHCNDYRTISSHLKDGTAVQGFYDETDCLVEVFKDGKITKEYTFDEIRNRADVHPWETFLPYAPA